MNIIIIRKFLVIGFLLEFTILNAQTIGTTQYEGGTYEGYSIVHPISFDTTYLINNCGQVINKWQNDYSNSTFAEITKNGTLIRSSIDPLTNHFLGGGAAGIIQELDWNGNVIWEHSISNSNYRLHHDMEILPNGNILVIAWELKNYLECVQAGRNPGTLSENEIWSTTIFELEPTYPNGANIVWEWHAWDHLVQDYDNLKDNFGDVQTAIQRIDINKGNPNDLADWAHVNAIHYNMDLDHIILSSPNFNEIWMIDHSTTSIEAASSSGGNRGVGGDLLWRWGNPASYNSGNSSDQQLFFQHDCQWVEEGTRFNEHISVFDNRDTINGQLGSKTKIMHVPFDHNTNSYPMDQGVYLPLTTDYTYELTDSLFSPRLSGVQALPNDNLLISSGSNGHIIEIDSNDNVLWQYKLPIHQNGSIGEQNIILNNSKTLFKMNRYAPDYEGFSGKNMLQGPAIEINPIECITSLGEKEFSQNIIKVYPNPTNTSFTIEGAQQLSEIIIFDVVGRITYRNILSNSIINIECSDWDKGIYFININNKSTTLIVE